MSHAPPPWNGPLSSGRPRILNGSPYPPSSGTQHVAVARSTPGIACEPLDAVAQQLLDAGGRDVLRAGERHAHRQHVARVEAGFTLRSADERADQQRGPDQQQQRQRHLDDDEDRASLVWRKVAPDRPMLSLSVALRSVRELCSAGTRPKSIPVPTETAAVNGDHAPVDADERALLRRSSGSPAVLIVSSARMPTTPSTSPMAPPITESATLSVSSWRMIRPRPAPMAARSATSRLRAVARTSSRLATLAQAISRTNATAALRMSSVGRALLTNTCCSGSTLKLCSPAAPVETSRENRCADCFSRACACSSVTPGLTRRQP